MRIVITVPTFPPFNSGLGNAVERQAKALVERGADVVVCTGGSSRGSHLSDDGYQVEQFAVSGTRRLRRSIRGDVEGYLQFLARSRADLVLMNAWQTWSTDVVLQNMAHVPGRKVVYSHCLSTDILIRPLRVRQLAGYLLWRPYRWRLGKILRALDAFFVLAETGCDCRFDDARLARRLGVSMHVVPNMLPAYALEALDQSIPFGSRGVIMAVGAYEAPKGHDFVLKAYAASHAFNKVPLVFFGQRETPLVNDLKRLAEVLGIREGMAEFRVGVSGTQLISEYKNAIAFVSGSQTECQPLVLLDAMATGTPFVARATGCIPGLSGGVTVRTPYDAAKAIDSLMLDEANWHSFSETGRKAAIDDYLPDTVGRRLWNAVTEVLA